MNIKSLILGSATAALAVTGAQAADAIIIAEPEPVEYVRVCDVYGAGFFYIPGTETCLRVGAEIRYQVGTGSSDDLRVGDPAFSAAGQRSSNFYGFREDTWTSHSRARIYLDARSETELGQLRGYVRLDTSRTNGAAGGFNTINNSVSDGTYLNHAWLSLGGFRAGWTDSAWVHTPQGGSASYGSHSDTGLDYGYQQAHLIQYNFSGNNGFFGTISLEDDNQAGTNYVPDIVGVVGVNQGWGAAWLRVGYDDTYNTANDSGFGVNAGIHYNIPGAPGSSFRLLGWYADSDNQFAVGRNANLGTGAEWSVMASYFHRFNAQFGASLAVQYFSDLYQSRSDLSSNRDAWAVELHGLWTPVENFAVRTEIVYRDVDVAPGLKGDSISGFVRFSRFF